jgi:hypothetical protein
LLLRQSRAIKKELLVDQKQKSMNSHGWRM